MSGSAGAPGGVAFRGAPPRRSQPVVPPQQFQTVNLAPRGSLAGAPPPLDLPAEAPRPGGPPPAWQPDREDVPLTARAKRTRKIVTARTFLLLIGTLILLLMCVIPLWDAMRLLDEPTFVFFMGRGWPHLMISACVSTIVSYVVIIFLFFKYSRSEYKTEQTVMMIGMIVCTGLGLALLCISQPLTNQTLQTYEDLFFHCDFGAKTQKLYEYAMVLQLMRERPECLPLKSVEQCPGYQETQPYTGFLRTLEARYQCSGFCSDPRAQMMQLPFNMTNATADGRFVPAEVANATAYAALADVGIATTGHASGKLAVALQRWASRRKMNKAGETGVGELSTEHADRLIHELDGHRQANAQVPGEPPVSASVYTPGIIDNYPPTLFSQANYKVSCEGQAARVLKYEALDVARVLYIEGLALLFTTVAVSMFKLGALCEGSGISVFSGAASRSSRPKEVIL